MLNARLLYSINMQEVGSTEQLNQLHHLHQSHAGRRHTSRKYLTIRYNMLTHTGVAHLYIFHFLNAVKRALHSSLKLQLGIPTGIHRNLALIKVHMQRHRHQVPSTKTDPEHVTGSHGSYPTLNSITKFSQF